MECGFNIYEKIQEHEERLQKAEAFVETIKTNYPEIYRKINKSESFMDDDPYGFYIIPEILLKYKISRMCLHRYRKLVPLKKSTKFGRFDRFRKKKVHDFMEKIAELKESNSELFIVNIKRAK